MLQPERERDEQQFSPTKTKSTGEPYKPMVMICSTEALVARAQGVNNRKEKPSLSSTCRFCDGYHWSDECPRYTTMDARKQRTKGCCYICLREGHNASECLKRVSRCYYCRQQYHHHRSLCPQKFGKTHRESAKLAEEMPMEDGPVHTEKSYLFRGNGLNADC